MRNPPPGVGTPTSPPLFLPGHPCPVYTNPPVAQHTASLEERSARWAGGKVRLTWEIVHLRLRERSVLAFNTPALSPCVCVCVCVCWHHTQPAHLLLMPFSRQQYQKSGSFSPGSEILQVCSRPHSPPPTHSPFLLIRGGWSQSPALLPGDPSSRGRRPVLSPLTRATCPTSS